MRYFVCLLDPEGRGIPEALLRRYEVLPRAQGLEFEWHRLRVAGAERASRGAVMIAWNDPWGPPPVVCADNYLSAGTLRLDNREDLERWAECQGEHLPDVELVRRVVARHGTKYVPQIAGDFAFVVWNGTTRTVIAAVDAFAVKKLYYNTGGDFLAFASRAEALALEEEYDVQFLAELVATCVLSPELSPYAGVKQLPAATLAVGTGGRLTFRSYWSPAEFGTDTTWVTREREAADTCRELLAESVRLRLGPVGATWAQLSGGLDSSSIVSVAQWLAEHGAIDQGLDGTVTYVDMQGTESDEREYSDAVVARWGVHNHPIVNPPFWHDGEANPPRTDWPRESVALYPRERRLVDVVAGAGGRVLLTGFAGDEMFTGTMYFFADWIAQGRVGAALREMTRRAAIGRASVWDLAYQNAFLPLVPDSIRRWIFRDQGRVLPWITLAATRRYQLRNRITAAATYAGALGRKYHHALVTNVTAISRLLDPGFLGDELEVRYPFLYRPLVEFALRLPPELCVRPQARKWILREAMRGILPEVVRTRIGKGGVTSLLGWSLTAQRPLLEPLLREPMLAEFGIVDAAKLRRAFDAAPHLPHRDDFLQTAVQSTLILEAWLQLRSNRWPPKSRLRSAVPEAVAV